MRRILLVCLLLCGGMGLQAQMKEKGTKFQVELDYHYFFGLAEKYSNGFTDKEDLYGNSLRLQGIYRITPRWTVGAGIGLDRYENPGRNTMPVFLIGRYSPFRHYTKPYVFSHLGYTFKNNNMNMDEGVMWETGIGYKHMFRKHFGLKVEVGYNLKNFQFSKIYKEWPNSNRHSLSTGLAMVF